MIKYKVILKENGFYFYNIFSFTLESSMTSKQPYNTTNTMPENRNQMNNCNVADPSKGRWKVKNRPTYQYDSNYKTTKKYMNILSRNEIKSIFSIIYLFI